jgi:hypothetical protein
MKAWRLVFVTVLMAVVLAGCNNPAGSSDDDPGTSNTGDTPTLTDIKIVADVSQIFSGPFITTLSSGTKYYVLFYAADKDLDISKVVIDYTKNGAFVGTDEVSASGQTLVSDIFLGVLEPLESGTWKADAYVEDARGHKSNKKSITVTVK